MRAIFIVSLGFLTLGIEQCGEGEICPESPLLDADAPPETRGDWYEPTVTTTWQWQLQGSINSSYDVDLYDIDLFDTTESQIASLKAQGRHVICYFSAGSAENWRPDYAQFEDCALGDPLDGWPGEVWVDIRSDNVVQIMLDRLDLAADKGCDGVEPDNVDGYTNNTGFSLTPDDQLAYNKLLANEAHTRGLTVGLKNDVGQTDALVDYYDFALNEECHTYNECETLYVFTSRGKPVFNAEYAATVADAERKASTLCPVANAENFRTLILPLELDDSFRVSCDE